MSYSDGWLSKKAMFCGFTKSVTKEISGRKVVIALYLKIVIASSRSPSVRVNEHNSSSLSMPALFESNYLISFSEGDKITMC